MTITREQGYAIEGDPKPIDDTAPERLRERREALGWHRARAADGMPLLWHDIECLETGRTDEDAADRARYAAALSAEEERRAERPAPRFKVGDAVVSDDGMRTTVASGEWVLVTPSRSTWAYWCNPGGQFLEYHLAPASPPAPEVVDVPQPETWHARLVRLAREAQAASAACAEAEAAFARADAERETARKARAAAREACHAKRQALTAATTAAAIVEAAEARQDRPDRPEPRYQAGDWVRNNDRGGAPYRIAEIADAFNKGVLYYREHAGGSHGQSWQARVLTLALDPALNETARRTVAWLRDPLWASISAPIGMYTLPLYLDWIHGADRATRDADWAAQLERLLVDAP